MRKTHLLATKTKKGEWPTRDLAGIHVCFIYLFIHIVCLCLFVFFYFEGATRLHGRTFGIIGIGRIGTVLFSKQTKQNKQTNKHTITNKQTNIP